MEKKRRQLGVAETKMASPEALGWSLTGHLLGLNQAEFRTATESPFLLAAGQGRLSKDILGRWLANDRLYIHAYIKAVGRTLSVIDLPQVTTATESAETQLVDWLFKSLTELRREERFFIDVARRYGLSIDLEATAVTEGGLELKRVPGTAKLPGLVMFERLFGSLHPASSIDRDLPLPWLEAAIVFWGTEKVYSEAWTWAKSKQDPRSDGSNDADGGALRKEFVPNWGNEGFSAFVDQLAAIIDGSVQKATEKLGGDPKELFVKRVEAIWNDLLAAEAAFWPKLD